MHSLPHQQNQNNSMSSASPLPGDMVLGTPHHQHKQLEIPFPRSGDMVLGFMPSEYQRNIFDWLLNGTGSCVVCAVPGSGKTTTLIKGTAYIPKTLRSRFLAFNKHIASELETRLPKHISSSTIHSLGLSSIARKFRGLPEIDKQKYSKIVTQYLKDRNIYNLQNRRTLIDLVRFTQLTLTNPNDKDKLKKLYHHYGLFTWEDWDFFPKAVFEILEQGIHISRKHISYEDMIWLPNVLELPVASYDFLCVDEAQDLNTAQLEIVMKAHRAGARGIYVGDTHQAIMGFCASDHRSISKIIGRTDAILFPLSICYRCPTSHIELANKVYPVIESSPQALVGIVEKINKAEILDLVRGGDLVICRCFYPLVPVYLKLLSQGIPALIRNKDISVQLLNLLVQIVGEGCWEFTPSKFTDVLHSWYQKQKTAMQNDGVHIMIIVGLHDRIQTLNAIYKGNNCTDTESLVRAINQLGASAETHRAVNLTTIHGAKGLEAKRVFHLRPDLVPHPKAEKDWEKEQEKNLQFVALTRAKEALFLAI
ncbi:MAG: UvrD-helicase domain-containing protein [Xenococcaceae cyanobacterium]